ncbi:MAG: nucleotidyltransferase substrate binding protein [Lachnospiraceae bacterium]|nr:nucleotidyltransferase substrate binding protein [Lachnospiraceae bacterium]
MDAKFTNRYNSYCSSLSSLEKALTRDPADEFVLSGTVQKFSLTFDISWKVMKDILVKYHKIQSFAAGSPRETLRTAYSVQLISDDAWMNMLNMRNELSHDYDGSMARDCFDTIVHDYIPLFQQFRAKAGTFMEQI